MNQLIVFVFPSTINFGSGQSGQSGQSGRTKTISVYNPYDFSLKFNFLSTNPNAFSLSSASGLIRSRHLIDVVIRLRNESRLETTEQFLIAVKEVDNPNPRTGERVLPVTNCAEQSEADARDHRFAPITAQSLPTTSEVTCRRLHGAGGQGGGARDGDWSNQVMTYAMALVCILVLLIPHETRDSSSDWFTIGFTHKLVVAYILGLLTVLILRK